METGTTAMSVLEKFFDDFPQKGKLLIIAHNHPDPDSISSAAALKELASVLGKAETHIAYGGIIGRAENAHMVKYLKLQLKPIDEVDIDAYDRIAMVDTQPKTGNNALPAKYVPDLVIDHHPIIAPTKKVPFVDIRLDYGATASILAEYLFQFDLPIDKNLATALLYGIKSETQDLGREANDIDVENYLKLLPIANKKLLSKIVNSRVPRSYFKFLMSAIQNAQVYGSVVVSRLGEVENPDIVPEVADLLLRMESATWSFCSGIYKEGVYISFRTTNTRKNAGVLMKQLMKGRGMGGGHGLIAGGKIDVPGKESWETHDLQKEMETLFLKKVQKKQCSPSPLTQIKEANGEKA